MKSLFRPFPLPLTHRQWFYLLFLQGVGAGLIDGGINFAVAYAMYHSQSSVKMWVFSENTMAGDLGVTPIITCAVSMLITSTLVHTDLHHHAIAPLPFVYPHVEHLPDPRQIYDKSLRVSSSSKEAEGSEDGRPELNWDKGGIKFWYLMLMRFIFEGTEKSMLLAKIPVSNWFGRLGWTAAQGAGIGILFGFPIWCLAIVILGPIYGTRNIGGKWAPQTIKLVYGAIIGWLTNPVIASLALGSQAEHHLLIVEHDVEEATDRPETIPEESAAPQASPNLSLRTPPALRRGSVQPSTSNYSLRLGTTRSRRASSTSRPPLTTDVSLLPPILPATPERSGSTNSPAPPSLRRRPSTPLRGGPLPRQTSEPVNLSRIRSISVSGPPTATSPDCQLSYALGGTGGRAQRPRASTRASASGTSGLLTAPLDNIPWQTSSIRTPPASAPLSRGDVRDVFTPPRTTEVDSRPTDGTD